MLIVLYIVYVLLSPIILLAYPNEGEERGKRILKEEQKKERAETLKAYNVTCTFLFYINAVKWFIVFFKWRFIIKALK